MDFFRTIEFFPEDLTSIFDWKVFLTPPGGAAPLWPDWLAACNSRWLQAVWKNINEKIHSKYL